MYQARDTKLDRDVALKVLPEAFTSDPDRLARFEREAKVLASLNHPNIGGIHGLEESGGVKALVLELIDGPTLAERIARGPIPLDEAFPIAKQIAEALEAAHEAGVIHRDLKPANIKVREDGTVKVLDFGLAKALDAAPAGDPDQSPTLTAAATQMGVIMGTAAYMSPEQARGNPVDKRADIWAFGVVLFEMVTGTRAFPGRDVSETLAGVIKSEPRWEELAADTPTELGTLLRCCLEKEPRRRMRDIGDVRLAIEGTFEPRPQQPEATQKTFSPVASWKLLTPVALAVFALGVGVAWVWGQRGEVLSSARLGRFEITTAVGAPLRRDGPQPVLAISRDGSRVVYRTTEDAPDTGLNGVLYTREIDQLDATPIRGTEGAYGPFFSPDGEWIAFNDGRDNTLKRVSILGGPPLTICALDGFLRGASWGTNDTIVFATVGSGGLLQVPAVGGEPEVLTTVDSERETNHWWPELLPGNDVVLFTAWSGTSEGSRIAALSLETGEVADVVPGGSFARFSDAGHVVYGVGTTLRAVGFDRSEMTVIGNPVPVVEDVDVYIDPTGSAQFGMARDGSLIYVSDDEVESPLRTLVWVDRDGNEEALSAPERFYNYPRVSPDGTRVTLDTRDAEDDVWVWDLTRETLTRLTFNAEPDHSGVWTPDARRIVFSSERDGAENLYWRAADGTGGVERLTESEHAHDPNFVSPDGEYLVFGVSI